MEHICPRRLSWLHGWVARATKRAREIGWSAMLTKTGPLYDVVICFINIRRMFQFPSVNRISDFDALPVFSLRHVMCRRVIRGAGGFKV